ncbi:hypothetical protein M569_07549 [Genlisea aurea]|uniref:Uncharacterized protein n=1 Tax=Genlisea aurea TaxID=192259 RepID=S8CQT2_9LAMI|nr:hypothetical protein M569_07549 [Genlisea aurea]
MGRGGGGGGSAGKRPPVNRAVSTGRLPKVGGPRGRVGASSDSIISPPTTSFQVEESFSLVRENPLNFGMAIKLAPDLVDEIKRVEAHGGSACIKFDAHANNPGNVIRVGDKIYRFTWSKEPGDLCDIYEETQNGGDGNGLLVESGGTWRKLNVERELDESTKNLVKKRSEEAEQKLKSRKAIVLDPQNPSMKNQMKAIAASESNPWRNFKNRKEYPSKKRKFEPPAAGLPSSVPKSGSSATHISRGNLSSSSPLLSHQERHCPQTSPAGSGHHLKGYVGAPEVLSQSMDKTLDPDRETLPKLQNGNAAEKVKQTGNMETKPSDIRGPMISLLLEHNDRGMLFKARNMFL